MPKLARQISAVAGLIIWSYCQLSLADSTTPLFIQVAKTKLRSSPQLLSPALADLKFGDELDVVSQEGSWIHVRTKVPSGQNVDGYIHESVTTKKKIILAKDQTTIAQVAVDETNVYLAGKGFNESATQAYQSQNPAADLKKVDALQSRPKPSENSLEEFIQGGSLQEKK